MAAALAAHGQMDEAHRYLTRLRKEYPAATAERIVKRAVMLETGRPEFLRALRLAIAAPDTWESPGALAPQPAHDATPVIPILVLPFGTSGETSPQIQLIADMITDDLTNGLSRVASFRVISRQTTRSLQSQPIDVAALSAELKVRYVLEGSLRLQEERLRLNVELIDPATRLSVWSGRIERDGADRQGVRDEVVARLARELQFETLPIESARLSKDFDAGSVAYRGWAALSDVNRQGYEEALVLFEQALERDPQNLSAQIGIGAYHARMGAQVFDTNSLGHRAKAEQTLRDAVRRDPQSSDAHFYLGLALNLLPTLPEALEQFARAIEIEPSHASAHAQIGNGLIRSGRVAEGLEHVRYAMRLSPRDPIMPVWLEFAGNAELELKNFPEAIELFRRSTALNPGYPRSWAGLRGGACARRPCGRCAPVRHEAQGVFAEPERRRTRETIRAARRLAPGRRASPRVRAFGRSVARHQAGRARWPPANSFKMAQIACRVRWRGYASPSPSRICQYDRRSLHPKASWQTPHRSRKICLAFCRPRLRHGCSQWLVHTS